MTNEPTEMRTIMVEQKRFIFPLKVMQWSTLQAENGQKLKPGGKMKAIGFIPVYEDIQSMCDDHGHNAEYGTFDRRGACDTET
jgi:hypothetical protein